MADEPVCDYCGHTVTWHRDDGWGACQAPLSSDELGIHTDCACEGTHNFSQDKNDDD